MEKLLKLFIKVIIVGGIMALLIPFMTSCVTPQKRLQRRIERNGIKESIGFVIKKYPEYFKSKEVVKDTTLVIKDSLLITRDTITVTLADSNNLLTVDNDSIKIEIDKTTNKAKIEIKERYVYRTDTIQMSIDCPKVICPDCEDLKDYSKDEGKTKISWRLWIALALSILINVYFIRQKFTFK